MFSMCIIMLASQISELGLKAYIAVAIIFVVAM